MKKAIFYGILSSLFFAFTFVFNRSMNLTGGYWMYSASLRYIFTLPMMLILVGKNDGIRKTVESIKKNPLKWIIWSTVGFGLFYAPLTMASVYGESWFVAAMWQLTIVAGVLLTPLFGKRIPHKNLFCSFIILAGIFLLQSSHFTKMDGKNMIFALVLVLIAAFSYPLGNRKMMEFVNELTTNQRVFGMTLCSMPFWILMTAYAWIFKGPPSISQSIQSVIVAFFSGVLATVLFFEATNLVKNDPKKLAVVEATQSGEVIFTLIGGVVFLKDKMPATTAMVGIFVIVLGMILNSLSSSK